MATMLSTVWKSINNYRESIVLVLSGILYTSLIQARNSSTVSTIGLPAVIEPTPSVKVDLTPYVPVCDFAINDGDVRRLWSYNCATGGKYVFVSNSPSPQGGSAFVVQATGEAQGTTSPLTDITFNMAQPIPLMFELSFMKDNTRYAANGSEYDLVASEFTDTTFEVMQLWSPNKPYVVLRSNKKIGNDDLFVSSDGAGNMQLKLWNKPVPDPPNTTSEVDPSLLFRLVRPRELTYKN